MRLALCHDWFTTYSGADQVAAALADVFDITDVYTFAKNDAVAAELFPDVDLRFAHRIGTTAFARDHWGWLLPLMPYAWSRLDLSGYDVVLTSAHSCVNSIRVPSGTPVISYCHTPMRYAWEWRRELGRFPLPARALWPVGAALLRAADKRWASHVTKFVANSHNVADRIARYYGREATVVHPPIDTDYWTPDPAVEREDFFLYAGRLVAYKRPDIAVHAANRSGVRLVVAGSGPESKRLKVIAGPSVEFVESPTREALRDLYRRTRALVFPGVEDFGMTLVEAQACGAPVIARGEGGAVESVQDGVTGTLYTDPSPAALAEVLVAFVPSKLSVDDIVSNAARFRRDRFEEQMRDIVAQV
jgi:glycosyltransferase involved in cell wall biosynthesis